MRIHSDGRINKLCKRLGYSPDSEEAEYIRLGFDNWDTFYAYFATALDGYPGGDHVLRTLTRVTQPGYIMPVNTPLIVARLITQPGKLREWVEREDYGTLRGESERELQMYLTATPTEFTQAVAVVANHFGEKSDTAAFTYFTVCAIVLAHGATAFRTAASGRDLCEDATLRWCLQRVLDAGTSAEYARDVPLYPELVGRWGVSGYQPQEYAVIEQAGVPASYVRDMAGCLLGSVNHNRANLIRVYEMGVAPEYLMAVNNAMLRDARLIQSLSFDDVLAAYQAGIPTEYLTA